MVDKANEQTPKTPKGNIPKGPNFISGWVVLSGTLTNLAAFQKVKKGVTANGKHYLSLTNIYNSTDETRVQIATEQEVDQVYKDIITLLNAPVHDPDDVVKLPGRQAPNDVVDESDQGQQTPRSEEMEAS